jgi:PAS domain S-box-containing protein
MTGRDENGQDASNSSHSERSFRLLVEQVSDYAIFLLDPHGRVTTWNRGAEKIKGWSADEIVGHSFELFYPPEAVARGWPQQELKLARENGRYEEEGWRVRKDGTRFWADVVITALRDERGELEGYAKVTRDLSERRELVESLRRSEERLRLLVDGVDDAALYLLDPAGHVTSWNSGAQRIKGYTAAEIIGHEYACFFTPEDRARGLPARQLESARRHGQARDDGWRVRKDGTRFWAHTTLTALRDRDGQPLGFAKITRDRTDTHRGEALQDSRRQLDELLVSLSRELVRDGLPAEPRLAQLAQLVDEMLGASRGAAAAEARPAEAPPVAAADSAPPGQARRILVVDDNRDAADGVAMLLRRVGHSVRVAYDGRDALTSYDDFVPDTVLLDIGLPGMTGFEVAAGLRERQGGRRLRLLAITGYGQDGDRQRSREAGFDGHLVKPVAVSALLTALQSG